MICDWFGHKYSPRYNMSEPTVTSLSGCYPSDGVRLMEASKRKTYVHDVCERCGATTAAAATPSSVTQP